MNGNATVFQFLQRTEDKLCHSFSSGVHYVNPNLQRPTACCLRGANIILVRIRFCNCDPLILILDCGLWLIKEHVTS
jgi:hypothetical protein